MLKGLTPAAAKEILARVGSEEDFFGASERALSQRLGWSSRLLSNDFRSEALRSAQEEISFISGNENIRLLYHTDPDYPQRLLECDDAPLLLYTIGNANLNATHVISIVGTRNATTYGVRFIEQLVDDLKKKLDDVLIVSGLALGCDITAHKRALENGIPTVGVLAHGLDIIYPAENRGHAARMVREGGMLITDYPHNTRPHKSNFLARNRIVAGMSDCIIVAESAAARGGALHTARLGLCYNRDVFALPGRTCDHFSGGCNMLIKTEVAAMCESADDIIARMNWKPIAIEGQQAPLPLEIPQEQQLVIDYICQNGEAQINELTAALGLPVGQLMGMLVEMEFNGLVCAMPGARYRLA